MALKNIKNSLFKKDEVENKEFDLYEVQEGQVEEGVEYNEVTTDDTIQDTFNEDSIEDLVDEEVLIENVEYTEN